MIEPTFFSMFSVFPIANMYYTWKRMKITKIKVMLSSPGSRIVKKKKKKKKKRQTCTRKPSSTLTS